MWALLALLLIPLVSCEPAQRSPHVVLISIDTLRADALGVYGQAHPTSPTIDALAVESVVFDQAFTASGNTIVAHASLLTGLHPPTHGVMPDTRLEEESVTLAERLRAAGYATAGFTSHVSWLSVERGFAQGFDSFKALRRDGRGLNRRVLRWLDRIDVRMSQLLGQPIFLFAHYYDAHSAFEHAPYVAEAPLLGRFAAADVDGFDGCREDVCASVLLRKANEDPSLMSPAEVQWARDRYLEGVLEVDELIGELFAGLRNRGLFDEAWIVITADHGEGFREHGHLLHGHHHVEIERIPLIVRPPKSMQFAPQRVAAEAHITDIVPTLLDLLGIAPDSKIQGRSLAPAVHGQSLSTSPLFFRLYSSPTGLTLRQDGWLLIEKSEGSDVQLFDIRNDPGELVDVSGDHPTEVARLRSIAARHRRDQLSAREARTSRHLIEASEQEREHLRALGYVD